MTIPYSQRYSLNLYLINSVEEIVVFLGSKVFNSDNSGMSSCSSNAQVTFVQQTQWKIIIDISAWRVT